jgi:type III restriction enzyme
MRACRTLLLQVGYQRLKPALVTEDILKRLQPLVPLNRLDQQRWFDPDFSSVPHRELRHFQNMSASLKRALVYGSVHSSIGLTRSCLDHAVQGTPALSGVFAAVRTAFLIPDVDGHLKRISDVNEFRNTYVAHHEKALIERPLTEQNLKAWIDALAALRT